MGAFATAALPAQPQTFDTTYTAPTGNVINVASGGDLQAALNSANLGDTIVLQAGAKFTGPFTLPNKTSGSGWIYVRSSAYGNLPAPGKRVAIADAANMPKILATLSGITALKTVAGSHHFRFVGIEFAPVAGNFIYTLVTIGNSDTSAATLPTNIVFDRCYIHGDAIVGGRRGLEMDGKYIAVINSYFADFKESGSDSQAAWAYNTTGPLQLINNHFEAAGENVMFGGADATIPNAVPSDIEIRRNDFYKPLTWITASWTVKNLLEFKNARRVLVDGNVFTNNWLAAQSGFTLLLTPRNQNGSAPWSATQDIAITNNQFSNIGSGINILATDSPNTSQRTDRVLIRNNLFSVTALNGADGRLFQLLSGPLDVTIDHNTGFLIAAYGFSENSPKADQFDFTNNLVANGKYGFTGTSVGDGTSALTAYYTNWTFTHNAVISGVASNYPTGNLFPATTAAVQFVNFATGDFHLASSSPYKSAGTDGKDIGADIDAILRAYAGGTLPAKPNPLASFAVH